MKGFLVGVLTTVLVGCSSLSNLIPDKFDNVEYGNLVHLGVISENTKDCSSDQIQLAWSYSAFLEKYSEHTMNETNQKIYTQIHDLTTELRNRQDPSEGYCRIKWGNISSIVEEALAVAGSRMK